MSQKKLIIYLLFITLVCFLNLLGSCAKEEFKDSIINSERKNNISFEQFKRETGLVNFETRIKIKRNINNNSARNSDGSSELSD